MINNKFIFYRTYSAFENDKTEGKIPEESIVFIKDKQLIYTHDTMFQRLSVDSISLGYFPTESKLIEEFPNGFQSKRAVAFIGANSPYNIYVYDGKVWVDSGCKLNAIKGDDGPTGPRGPKGDTGLQGPKGDDGKSAYEVAVDEGFAGDEQEWLDSLIGPKGDKGEKGDPGNISNIVLVEDHSGSKGDYTKYYVASADSDSDLYTRINNETDRAAELERILGETLQWIESIIPSGAITSGKMLATEEYVQNGLADKQNTLTFDDEPKATSNNPVKSKGIYSALEDKQNKLTFDTTPTKNSTNPVTSDGIRLAIDSATPNLQYDDLPTANSEKLVKSGRIYVALGDRSKLTFDTKPTNKSKNPVESGGIYSDLEDIRVKIPIQASAGNQLADKNYVNSGIATATATFRGTYHVINNLSLPVTATHEQIAAKLLTVVTTADLNDYCFVQIPESSSSSNIIRVERYKYANDAWSYEYDLNNSGFTSAQWAAINSGVTAEKFAKKVDGGTTLEHYGIGDAKIDNGVITLGSNTITPLTKHQDISGKSDIDHTHKIKINGNEYTIPASNNSSVNIGTYLTSISLATDTDNGGVKIGYTQNGKNYPVKLDGGKAYVNVPWTDTTYLVFSATLAGLVPAASDANKLDAETAVGNHYLCADGKFRKLPANAFKDTTYTFTDYNPTLSWSTTNAIGKVGGTELNVTMPDKPTYTLDDVTDGSTRKLDNYLPLTGGTVNGKLTVSSNNGIPLTLRGSDTACVMGFRNGDGVQGYVGYNGYRFGILSNNKGIALRSGDLKPVYYDGISEYFIWHANNDGAGTGLDADLLDGEHGAYYAKAVDVNALQGYFTNGVANNADKLDGLSGETYKTRIVGESQKHTSGWYRVLECELNKYHSMSFFLTFYGLYNRRRPSSITFLVNVSYGYITIRQIGANPHDGYITKVRAVSESYTKFYIDAYFRNDAEDIGANETIDFEVTPLDPQARDHISVADYSLITDSVTPVAEVACKSMFAVDEAAKLTTARTINGTSFDGSANITTTKWGTARNISITDSFSTHTSSPVSVDGSANVTLNLPTTITATLDGKAASATKLATPRTIWGQSFDGSANISGRMYGVDGIANWMYFNNNYGSIGIGGAAPTDYYVLKFYRNVNRPCMIFNDTRASAGFLKIEFLRNGTDMGGIHWFHDKYSDYNFLQNCINFDAKDGCVTFGTWDNPTFFIDEAAHSVGVDMSSPQHKLDVNGDIHATTGILSDGYVTALATSTTSDERLKDVKEDVELSVDTIAEAPSVKFEWKNNKELGEQVGTIAQYWEEKLPQVVHKNDEGDLSLQYDVTALLSSISLAKKVKEQDERIKTLEEQNKMLLEEIKQIKEKLS